MNATIIICNVPTIPASIDSNVPPIKNPYIHQHALLMICVMYINIEMSAVVFFNRLLYICGKVDKILNMLPIVPTIISISTFILLPVLLPFNSPN